MRAERRASRADETDHSARRSQRRARSGLLALRLSDAPNHPVPLVMGTDLIARSLLMVLTFAVGLLGAWLLHRHGLGLPTFPTTPAL